MSKLLIDDYPIQVLPKLAKEIGLNEAIVLQQIHYWLNKRAHLKDGKYWTYGSIATWQRDQFFFWSVVTVKRVFASLEKQNLLIVGNYNKAGFDKTKWYSVNYEELERVSQRLGQNDPTNGSKWTDGVYQNDPTNTLDLPETSSDTKKSSPTASVDSDFEKLWKLYPNKKGNKETALKAYKKALKGGTTNKQIQDGIVAYKKHLAENDWLKPAFGSTWFFNCRWNDEYEEEKKSSYYSHLETMKGDDEDFAEYRRIQELAARNRAESD